MSKRRFIKPAQGRVVRDPVTFQRLPDEGDFVVWNGYWQRRLNDDDVIEAAPPKKAPARRATSSDEES